MKLKELKELDERYDDYDITVHKSDRGQLSCHTTVPTSRCEIGFDWTMNQVILHPDPELYSNYQSDDKVIGRLKFYSEERTKVLSHLARLSKLINDEIADGELKEKLRSEILACL